MSRSMQCNGSRFGAVVGLSVLTLWLAACGGSDGGGGSASPSTGVTVFVDPVPEALRGRWTAQIVGVGDPHVDVLTITANVYQVEEPGNVVEGVIAAESADRVQFSANPNCPGSGIYTWAVTASGLRFTAVGKDGCPFRTIVLTGKDWAALR